ncbi:MAG: hypothetical protein D4S01_05430 [Dehalococcoidia bacterium]|nr:MAG: hypothetical protein D4S01_05430 [Dehalococcoidia bacterium]
MSDKYSIEGLISTIVKNTENNCICSAKTLIEWMHRTISSAMNYTLRETQKTLNPEVLTIFFTEEIIADIIYATAGNRRSDFAFTQSDISSIIDETIRYVSLMRSLDKDIFIKFSEEKEDGEIGKTTKKSASKKTAKKTGGKKSSKEGNRKKNNDKEKE